MKAPQLCRIAGLVATLCLGLASASFGLGGPVVIGGDDADDHGSVSLGVNQFGWLYIESAFDVIGPCVDNGNKKAVCIGCNGGDGLSAFNSGFDLSNLPGGGWSRVVLTTVAQIDSFFDGSGVTNVNNSGIIYMPSDASNVSGGINSTQMARVNANAAGINSFVSGGGGLFCHTQSGVTGGYGWLTTLLPGIVVNPLTGCNFNTLNLTPQGQAAFPLLTDAIVSNATPWHNWFSGNLGGLDILVTGPCGTAPPVAQPVILGGCQVVIQQNIKLDPRVDFNPPGTSHTVTATLKDDLGAPVQGTLVSFDVLSGPNAGDSGTDFTNASGEATFSYVGDGGVGVDVIQACFVDTTETPDTTKCAQVVKFWDNDCNLNGRPDHCDVACGGFAGACSTFIDTCGTSADVNGDNIPDECNRPPDCSAAVACQAELWPPNHTYRAVSICGVTDPDGDPVTITVTGITQDEPLNTRGDGNTCPDGQIVGGQALVRAERTGTPGIPGNGRVYRISFTADDGQGGQCSGAVTVCVPHDQGGGSTCIDDGQLYNSVGPCRSGNSLVPDAISLNVGLVTESEARFSFALPADADVNVSVFDVSGRRVATLESGSLSSGLYERTWRMGGVVNGLYFVRLQVGEVMLTRKVVKAR